MTEEMSKSGGSGTVTFRSLSDWGQWRAHDMSNVLNSTEIKLEINVLKPKLYLLHFSKKRR